MVLFTENDLQQVSNIFIIKLYFDVFCQFFFGNVIGTFLHMKQYYIKLLFYRKQITLINKWLNQILSINDLELVTYQI